MSHTHVLTHPSLLPLAVLLCNPGLVLVRTMTCKGKCALWLASFFFENYDHACMLARAGPFLVEPAWDWGLFVWSWSLSCSSLAVRGVAWCAALL